MVFDDVVADEPYDLVVGDEAWDVDHFLHENPERKRFSYAWFTDFVGWLPMPDGGAARGGADRGLQRRDARAAGPVPAAARPVDLRRGGRRHGTGDLRAGAARDPGVDGGELRLHRVRHGSAARRGGRPARLRAAHGYREDERVCVVSVGGSGVGEALLRRVLDAVPLVRRAAPELRFLVVAGPRIDPESAAAAARRRGGRLSARSGGALIACDVAVVQGGLSTCMELTAARRPFVYVPLRHHFEQNFHVRRRLERYRAGRVPGLRATPAIRIGWPPRCWRRSTPRSTTCRSRVTGPSGRPGCWPTSSGLRTAQQKRPWLGNRRRTLPSIAAVARIPGLSTTVER